MLRNLFLLCVSATLLRATLYPQCSDAGVCVIGEHQHSTRHSVGFSYVFGRSGADSDLTIHTFRVDGTYHVTENSSLHLAIPYSAHSGPAGTSRGIGDLSVLWNQVVVRNAGTLRIQGGVKLATGRVNVKNLPQAYQSGLGTNDVLVGISYDVNNITVAAAYQLTTGRSANRRTRLKRGDDLMLRGGYTYRQKALTLGGEVLAIKRIRESNILVNTQPETFADLPKSDHLQINLVGLLTYDLDTNFMLLTEGAVALLRRDTNVDGLKRAFTFSLGLARLL